MNTFTIQQNIFKCNHHLPIHVRLIACHEQCLTLEGIGGLQKLVEAGHIGLAPEYDGKCRLSKLAMATASQVLLITLLPKAAASSKRSKKNPVRLALENILSNSDITAYVFKMDYVAAALYFDHGIHLAAGKRLLSLSAKKQLDGLMTALGGETTLNKPNVVNLFQSEESSSNEPKTTALQAWAAYQVATTVPQTCQRVLGLPVINTLNINKSVLIFIYYVNGRFLISV